MTELQKVLYDYAWEYQIPGLLRASQKEAADNDRMVEAALTRLRVWVRRARTWPSGWRADSSPGRPSRGRPSFWPACPWAWSWGPPAACERRTAVMPALRTGTTCWPR